MLHPRACAKAGCKVTSGACGSSEPNCTTRVSGEGPRRLCLRARRGGADTAPSWRAVQSTSAHALRWCFGVPVRLLVRSHGRERGPRGRMVGCQRVVPHAAFCGLKNRSRLLGAVGRVFTHVVALEGGVQTIWCVFAANDDLWDRVHANIIARGSFRTMGPGG